MEEGSTLTKGPLAGFAKTAAETLAVKPFE